MVLQSRGCKVSIKNSKSYQWAEGNSITEAMLVANHCMEEYEAKRKQSEPLSPREVECGSVERTPMQV